MKRKGKEAMDLGQIAREAQERREKQQRTEIDAAKEVAENKQDFSIDDIAKLLDIDSEKMTRAELLEMEYEYYVSKPEIATLVDFVAAMREERDM